MENRIFIACFYGLKGILLPNMNHLVTALIKRYKIDISFLKKLLESRFAPGLSYEYCFVQILRKTVIVKILFYLFYLKLYHSNLLF